jgi:hypothetical protein
MLYLDGDNLMVGTGTGKDLRIMVDESESGVIALQVVGPNGGVRATVTHISIADLRDVLNRMERRYELTRERKGGN